MKLGITGASGQLGTFLVRHALARTAPSNLVAITRNPAKLEEWAKQGVETRAGDFAQAAGLAEAFALAFVAFLAGVFTSCLLVRSVAPWAHLAARLAVDSGSFPSARAWLLSTF